jgi:hypothetical protein
MCHRESMCCGVHGRIADCVRAARTVGVHRRRFHGRPRTGRAGGVFRLDLNGGTGRALPCVRPAARAIPGRDRDGGCASGWVGGPGERDAGRRAAITERDLLDQLGGPGVRAERRFGRGCHHAFRAAGRTHRVGFRAVPVMPAGWLAEYGRLSAAGSSAWALEDWHGHRGQLRRLAPPRRLRRTGTR